MIGYHAGKGKALGGGKRVILHPAEGGKRAGGLVRGIVISLERRGPDRLSKQTLCVRKKIKSTVPSGRGKCPTGREETN